MAELLETSADAVVGGAGSGIEEAVSGMHTLDGIRIYLLVLWCPGTEPTGSGSADPFSLQQTPSVQPHGP